MLIIVMYSIADFSKKIIVPIDKYSPVIWQISVIPNIYFIDTMFILYLDNCSDFLANASTVYNFKVMIKAQSNLCNIKSLIKMTLRVLI